MVAPSSWQISRLPAKRAESCSSSAAAQPQAQRSNGPTGPYKEELYDCSDAVPTVAGFRSELRPWEHTYNHVRPTRRSAISPPPSSLTPGRAQVPLRRYCHGRLEPGQALDNASVLSHYLPTIRLVVSGTKLNDSPGNPEAVIRDSGQFGGAWVARGAARRPSAPVLPRFLAINRSRWNQRNSVQYHRDAWPRDATRLSDGGFE